MKIKLYLFFITQLSCAQNILGQFLPMPNGYPYQRVLGNQNQILNFRQPAPIYSYIQNQPNLPVINRQALNRLPVNQMLSLPPVNQIQNLPVLNGVPVLFNMPVVSQPDNLPIRNNVPVVPLNNQIIGNVPLVNSYNSLLINSLPFANVPTVNQLNTLPIVNQLNGLPFTNPPKVNSLANALNNLLYNGLGVQNKLPAVNNVPSYSNIQLPLNNLQLVNPNQNFNSVPNYLSSVPIVNTLSNNVNRNALNVLPVNKLLFGQPNNILANVPVSNSVQFIATPVQSLPIVKERQGVTLLVDNDLAEPLVSLNGLQLGGVGGFGNLPLFNGLPVIGMTESVINLKAV